MEDKRIEYAKRRTVWLRNYQRARGRALVRLANNYPDQYRDILEEERAKDEAEGKAWLDIHGRTSLGAGLAGHTETPPTKGGIKQALNNQGEASDLGGEE